jgi:[acyl-carrier-protein] S-malonyltransferase
MNSKVACLFPAFAMKYRDFSRECLDGHQENAGRLLDRAALVVEIDKRKFERPDEFTLDDTLQNDLQDHYVSYIDNCAIGSLLESSGVAGDYVAGYSMGLFAALYYSSAVSFEDGLKLMHFTCTFAHQALEDGHYGMGAIVGLTVEEVGKLIAQHAPHVEVADICGPRVVIASGTRCDLETLLEACEDEGSLQTRFLPVSVPFHSSLLDGVEERIRDVLRQIQIHPPRRPLVSCVNQKVLASKEAVWEEVARNVSRTMNWNRTMHRLLELGVKTFVECGLSESLYRLARNIKGDYRIYHPRLFDRLTNQPRPTRGG